MEQLLAPKRSREDRSTIASAVTTIRLTEAERQALETLAVRQAEQLKAAGFSVTVSGLLKFWVQRELASGAAPEPEPPPKRPTKKK